MRAAVVSLGPTNRFNLQSSKLPKIEFFFQLDSLFDYKVQSKHLFCQLCFYEELNLMASLLEALIVLLDI